MKGHFIKNYDKKKPKRWVLVYKGIDGEYHQPHYSKYQVSDVMKPFWKNEFYPSKTTYAGYCQIYFYFRSHAEEARFLLTYSDNIEKGFDL